MGSRPVEVEVSEAPLTSDAGLLPIAQFDEQIGLTKQFAAALHDPRDPHSSIHSYLSMVQQRVYGILADYEDQNDHTLLRSDPVFKLLAGRLPTDRDLASQPTLSRFENEVSISDLWRLRDLLVDQFIASFDQPPRQLTLDVDAFDDPTHGEQQLTFYHGYYEQHQYLPIVFTCAENDAALLVRLRRTVTPAAPSLKELGLPADLPQEALDTPHHRTFFNRRQLWDPLREGTASTWRTRLIKVAAEVIVRARRIIIRLAASWPYLEHFRQVSHSIIGLRVSTE